MAASHFYEIIGLDSKLKALSRKLDKKMFYDYADLKKKEKDVIAKHIERIELTYLLTPSTINIQPHINEEVHYEGVMFITVRLREGAAEKHIGIIEEIIHGALPNPVIVVFTLQDNILVSSCMKRINKVDKNSSVLIEIHQTRWINLDQITDTQNRFIESIYITNLSFNNFFEFYKGVDLAVEALQNAETTGRYHVEKNQEKHDEQQKAIQRIQTLEEEIKKLKTDIKKESQFNKKVELNMKFQQITKQVAELKNRLI